MTKRLALLVVAASFVGGTSLYALPYAQPLKLSLLQVTDLSGLPGLGDIGASAFDENTGNLWVADSTNVGNTVFSIDPLSGAPSTFFTPPFISAGPDGMAIDPISPNNLVMYSSFGEDIGVKVDQAGGLVQLLLPLPVDVGGASFAPTTSSLYTADAVGGALRLIDQTDGSISQTLATNTPASMPYGAMDYDPFTGHLFVLVSNTAGSPGQNPVLLELYPQDETAHVLAVTELDPAWIASDDGLAGSLAFLKTGDPETDGSLVFLNVGGGTDLVVLERKLVIPEPSTAAIAGLAVAGLSLLRRRRRV